MINMIKLKNKLSLIMFYVFNRIFTVISCNHSWQCFYKVWIKTWIVNKVQLIWKADRLSSIDNSLAEIEETLDACSFKLRNLRAINIHLIHFFHEWELWIFRESLKIVKLYLLISLRNNEREVKVKVLRSCLEALGSSSCLFRIC